MFQNFHFLNWNKFFLNFEMKYPLKPPFPGVKYFFHWYAPFLFPLQAAMCPEEGQGRGMDPWISAARVKPPELSAPTQTRFSESA